MEGAFVYTYVSIDILNFHTGSRYMFIYIKKNITCIVVYGFECNKFLIGLNE